MTSYIWKLFDKAWGFDICFLNFGFASFTRRTYHLSFGCWFRIASRDIQNQANPVATDETKIQYSPLEASNIRLFTLHPGLDVEVISGTIENKSWGYSSGNPYEALSYVWGQTKSPNTIIVNGYTVPITKSLEDALRHLRYPDRPRVLWVDYLCINQEDVLEKNQEVRKMGQIYESADSVVIWLGLETQDSPVGMEILRYFVNEPRPLHCPPWQTNPPSLAYQGLQDVFNRPWFQRMWVVQEIGRSHHTILLCGRDCVEWQSTATSVVRRIARMIKYAEISPQWAESELGKVDMQPLLEMLNYQYMNQFTRCWGECTIAAPDLLDLAHTMRHKQCADPRDKIFGLWGLVEYLFQLETFKLDYNMSIAQVYDELARVSFS
ncbi:heterokaryon incompatibility protein-domain-containing protein [Stachybotrys elegans]|uniref:Heterokaryon incompatibility protein-domain-containing protein n=1 Tax=Stachybotrys elegans TaxID=80388 RepID=A0A8K0SCG8_9HYPO|nr:heterokaryon incompatibility protein-domain-containing protein [Stachybotrys elegans]